LLISKSLGNEVPWAKNNNNNNNNIRLFQLQSNRYNYKYSQYDQQQAVTQTALIP